MIKIFDKSHCADCMNVDCLTRCQWIEFDNIEEARMEHMKMINGEDSRVLSECVTCFGCHEYCPYSSNPFDLILDLQEKYNAHNIAPKLTQMMISRYKPHDEVRLKTIDSEKPVLNKCAFIKTNAKNMEGKLFESLQYIAGLDFFCNLLFSHMNNHSIIKERVPIIMKNIKNQNINEMICFHDECYMLYASYCPRNKIEVPFKPIHLFEYLYKYLKDHESEINKLNMKIAYQRNCSNRFVPETDKWVDKICEIIGVERVQRKYDRENALCCAAPFPMLGKSKLVQPTQSKNIKDMLDHDAEACVYNCPQCIEILGKKVEKEGLKNYLLSDLCRMALREKVIP